MDDLRVAGTVKGLEVGNVQGVQRRSAGFSRRDQMQVVVNRASTNAACGRFLEGPEHIAGFQRRYRQPRSDPLAQQRRSFGGGNADGQPATGERGKALRQGIGVDRKFRREQQCTASRVVRIVAIERGHDHRGIERRPHFFFAVSEDSIRPRTPLAPIENSNGS